MKISQPSVKFVQVDDVELAYTERGSGPPLVMIMGLWGTMDIWSPSFLEGLAKKFKVITFDNRGMGLSTSSEERFTIPLFARDAAHFVRALGYERAHFLGWSMGANVAMELAIRHPEVVDRLVLYAGSCGGEESVPSSPLIEELISSPNVTREALVKSMFPREWNEKHPDIDEYYPKGTERTAEDILERQVEADEEWEGCAEMVSTIQAPVLIVNGSEDLDNPIENALLLVRKIPGSSLFQLRNAGHGAMYQCPRKVARIITAFLEDRSLGAGDEVPLILASQVLVP